jgi:peptidyl-prolyl cis-trans isomerase A (cyclophilin A)
MDVADRIAALPTHGLGPFANDVPDPLVVIESANVVGEEAPAPAASTARPATPAKSAAKPTPRPAARRGH